MACCYKCGSREKVHRQPFGENGREIQICEKCEWKYFVTHINLNTLSEENKKYIENEKKQARYSF